MLSLSLRATSRIKNSYAVLRAPPRNAADKKGVLRVPLCPSVDQKQLDVLRGLPAPRNPVTPHARPRLGHGVALGYQLPQ